MNLRIYFRVLYIRKRPSFDEQFLIGNAAIVSFNDINDDPVSEIDLIKHSCLSVLLIILNKSKNALIAIVMKLFILKARVLHYWLQFTTVK